MTTVLLHGFWGQPADWTEVVNRLPLGAPVWVPDLYQPGPLAPHHDITGFCQHFWEELDERVGRGPVQAVGYSMGGRLLVNLLLDRPERFSRALVLSANPLPVERSAWENEWREKFLNLPWDELEKLWDEQTVFTGSAQPLRRRGSVLREMLGQSLINWSPSNNIYLAGELKSIGPHVDWAFGARDTKYVDLASDLKTLQMQGRVSVLENAGHRLPFDAPAWIADWNSARAELGGAAHYAT